MWAYDFFQAPPTTKTLRTHLRANNAFAKCWFAEYYILPHEQRQGILSRSLRLAVNLMVSGAVVLVVLSGTNSVYGVQCSNRPLCQAFCVHDAFPELRCNVLRGENARVVHYGENVYDQLYRYADSGSDGFSTCRDLVPEYESLVDAELAKIPEPVGSRLAPRLPRTHSCFRACVARDDVEQSLVGNKDTRPQCRALRLGEELAPDDDQRALLCVVNTPCEKEAFERVDFSRGYGLAPEVLVVSMLYILPIDFCFSILFIYTTTVRVETVQQCDKGVQKCTLQWLILALVSVVFVVFSSRIEHTLLYGEPEFALATLLITIFVDQIRNILWQSFLWYVCLRKCGSVPLTDEASYARDEEPPQPLDIFTGYVQELVESWAFERAVYGALGIYSVLVLTHLSMGPSKSSPGVLGPPESDANQAFATIDFIFVCFFLIEIILHVIASGRAFLFSVWGIFDTVVIVGSFAVKFMESANVGSSLTVLRLLKILRLLLVLQKSTDKKNKAPAGVSFSTPVERVIEMLQEIKETKGLTAYERENIDWVADVIVSNKLYQIQVDTDQKADGIIDLEVKEWVKKVTGGPTDNKPARGNELENFIMGRSKRKQTDDGSDMLRKVMVETRICRDTRDTFNRYMSECGENWDFNIFYARELLSEGLDDGYLTETEVGDHDSLISVDGVRFEFDTERVEMLPIFVLHYLRAMDVYSFFDIPPGSIVEFTRALEQGYVHTNPFHNSLHAADVLQAGATILRWGDKIEKCRTVLNSQDKLSFCLAAAMIDYEHPGLTNQFLIRTKHDLCSVYHDQSVLEQHHVSAGFLCMLSCEPDPLCNVSEDQFQLIRKAIVKMILSTDLSQHFHEISQFKTKLSGKDFPASADDKQILLNILLRAADLSHVTRATTTSLRWAARAMEEFLRQGDAEKRYKIPVQKFFDRTSTSVAKCQMSYLEVFGASMFDTLALFIPEVDTTCVAQMAVNKAHYANLAGIAKRSKEANERQSKVLEALPPLTPTGRRVKAAKDFVRGISVKYGIEPYLPIRWQLDPPVYYAVGDPIEFWQAAKQTWYPTVVTDVDKKHNIQIEAMPREWIPLSVQKERMRRPLPVGVASSQGSLAD